MPALTTEGLRPAWQPPTPDAHWTPEAGRFDSESPGCVEPQPNTLVRWTFYLSVFCIPFTQLYLPGTGSRIGVVRLIQALIVLSVLSQPRVCVRLVPVALLWFLVYCVGRLLSGFWLTPELSHFWLPSTLHWLQFSLPWTWVMFNVLQFPGMGRCGLMSLVAGCSLCAMLHLAGFGVVDVAGGVEGRTTVFGENANVVGSTYAVAGIALVGLALVGDATPGRRLMALPLMALILAAMARTGSRTAVVILVMGIAVLFWQGQAFGSRIKRLATVMLIAAVLGGVATWIPTATERFEKLDATNIQQQEGRVRMIPVLWEMFLQSPILGFGPDDYQFELTRRAMPHLLRDQRLVTSHNLMLKLLVETGMIGFLLFAWGIKEGLASAWKARFKPCGALPLALLLPLVIAGIVLSDPSHLLVFWLAMAYALAGEG